MILLERNYFLKLTCVYYSANSRKDHAYSMLAVVLEGLHRI
jgi:hypothetical protein